ncbi:unnamed protein product, partial [Rotaria socialis]
LDELNQKLKHFQEQFTDNSEYQLDEFIQNYRLVPYTMKSAYQLARFDYEYQDQLLERQFLQLQPTDEQ